MDSIELVLEDIKPISINAAYYKNRFFKTATRQYRKAFLEGLLKYQEELKEFNKSFKKEENILVMKVVIETPYNLFFKKGYKGSV